MSSLDRWAYALERLMVYPSPCRFVAFIRATTALATHPTNTMEFTP